MKDYFRDKVAVVTGAGAGIGAELVRQLAHHGGCIVAADLDLEAVETITGKLCQAGCSVVACQADVRQLKDVQGIIDRAIHQFGQLDLIFNNAGVGLAGELRDVELTDWERIIDTNLWGVIHGMHAAYRAMLPQGAGQIVNISSASGLVPRPGMVPYATSKHAIVGLSTSLRIEAADAGIRVNVVCPMNVSTSIHANAVYRNVDDVALVADIPIPWVPVERCVKTLLKGVERNRAIITMPLYARVEWWLYRYCPPLAGLLLRKRQQLFLRHRLDPVDSPQELSNRVGRQALPK